MLRARQIDIYDNTKLMIALITIVHIIVCFFIIIVVLLQSGKSGDISAAFGGQGSQTETQPAAPAQKPATPTPAAPTQK